MPRPHLPNIFPPPVVSIDHTIARPGHPGARTNHIRHLTLQNEMGGIAWIGQRRETKFDLWGASCKCNLSSLPVTVIIINHDPTPSPLCAESLNRSRDGRAAT